MAFDISKFISSPGVISLIFFAVAFLNFKKGYLLKSKKFSKKDAPVLFYGFNVFLLIIGSIFLILGMAYSLS